MKLYVLTADTYTEDPCGSSIKLFGVFSEKSKAETRKQSLERNHKYDFTVDEISLDECCEIYLGGYIE